MAETPTAKSLNRHTRRSARAVLLSIDADGAENNQNLREVLADRKAKDPYQVTRRRLDWAQLSLSLNRRQAKVLDLLASGWRPMQIAKQMKLTPGRITQIKREIAGRLLEMGYQP